MSVTWTPTSGSVYTPVSGNFTFNDNDVSWVYVDWNDGEDNSVENAIYEWSSLETDSNTISLGHTYTQHGTFYPVIRTVNDQGIISKYFYSGGNVSNLPYPQETIQTITPITISDGNPLGSLKVENKTVMSGIDNNIFREGPKDVYIQPAPTVASGTATLGSKYFTIEAKCVVAIYNNTSFADLGYEKTVTTVEKTIRLNNRKGPNSAGDVADAIKLTDAKILEILEIKLITAKLTDVNNDDLINQYNKLKIFLIAQGDDGDFYPITYVTNGDPIKSLKDKRREVVLDFAESRAKASNATLSYYAFDNGKAFWQPQQQWQASSSTRFTSATETSSATLKENYTYYTRPDGLNSTDFINTVSNSNAFYSGNAWLYDVEGKTDYVRNQFLINQFNQFYDQYHLVRMATTTNTDKTNPLPTFTCVYRVRPPAKSTGSTAYFVNETTGSQDLTTYAYYNTTVYPVSTSKWADVSFLDSAGNARDASSYFVVGYPDKYGKVFINNSIYLSDFVSGMNDPQVVKGVYYLRLSNEKRGDKFTQKAEWVPLEFEDTTKIERVYRDTGSSTYTTKSYTLAQSGYISFNTPTDWSKTSMPDLCGGFFNTSGASKDDVDVTNDYSIGIDSVTKGDSNITNGPFPTVALTDASIGTNLADYTDEQMGGFKYLFQVSGGGSAQSRSLWIASSSIATDTIYVVSGTSPATTIPTGVKGFIRRINVYDVFDGASKTSDSGNVPNFINIASTAYSYDFMFGGDASALNSDLKASIVSGSFKDVYPLKIVLSGNTINETGGASNPPNQEIWNILPVISSSTQIIVQRDNTAYDLTYLPITSDVGVTFAGTFYQAMTKGGKVFVVRTGTPIQNITLTSKAMGNESSFSFSNDYTSFGALEKIRDAQSEGTRVMWDEQQKDGTWVRYFGFITGVTETHSVKGKRAPRNFTCTLVVQEIVLLNTNGELISNITPLGGVADARNFI